jgi:putative NADH-flavin reductase
LAVTYALRQGDEVIAYTRRENALTMKHENLKVIVGSLTDDEKLFETIQQADVIISALGPALSMSRKVKDLPIATAHEHIIKVMKKLQKKRFITLGTPTIHAREDHPQMITKLPSILAKVLYPTGYQEMKKIEQILKSRALIGQSFASSIQIGRIKVRHTGHRSAIRRVE